MSRTERNTNTHSPLLCLKEDLFPISVADRDGRVCRIFMHIKLLNCKKQKLIGGHAYTAVKTHCF